MKKSIFPVFCALITTALLVNGRAEDKKSEPVTAPVTIESRQVMTTLLGQTESYTDANQIMEVMTKAVQEHLEKDACTPMDQLMTQARDRKTCDVELTRESRHRLDVDELYARVRKGTAVAAILFKCPKCPNYHLNCASAFVVNKNGIFVTNYHVIEAVNQAKGQLVFVTPDGGMYPAKEVLAADKGKDLAIVKTPGTNLTPLPIAPDVQVGSPVYCLSHPRGHFYMFTDGIVSGKVMNNDKGRTNRRLEITADYAVGSSGAPIVNQCGAVVGVVSATSTVKTDGPAAGDVQMVLKLTVPSMDLLDLIAKPKK